ncbi:MAG: transposase, partial [Desulfotomaculaceae bacterium]
YKEYEKETRGQPPFHPALMTKILFYAYSRGIFSSRKIASRLYEEVAFNLKFLKRKTDAYIPAEKIKHNQKPEPAPRGRIPVDLPLPDLMKRKLRTKAGWAKYALRKQVVEPVFGQIKEIRGFRRFLLRGLDLVRGEWLLLCLTHNILKLFRNRDKVVFAK